MKERPILMSGAMVRAILDGTKTQTRRVVKNPELIQDIDPPTFRDAYGDWHPTVSRCPYGRPGDRLWVRETWHKSAAGEILYRADYGPESYEGGAKGWKPSIHMKRAYSRINLEVVGVRVERLQDISEADAVAEGMKVAKGLLYRPLGSKEPMQQYTHRQAFEALWNAINGNRYPWESNPWVWCASFRQVLS